MKLLLSTIFLLLLRTGFAQQNQTGKKYDFIVAKDGSGNFKTIQEAINAVPDMRRNETVIFIRNGIYKEKLVLAESKSLVHFIG